MSLSSSLVALGDGRLPATFEGLRTHLPLDWIESCLEKHGVATLRRRKLPVENVVWLIVGMALFRDRPIPEIVRRLDLVLPGEDGRKQDVAEGAITPARDRLGIEPLLSLFKMTAKRWVKESADRYPWRGLTLFGIDGKTLRIPDSLENRQEFGGHSGSNYPLVRLVMLMALRSRVALDFSLSGSATGEGTLAKKLLSSIPEHSLTILDRYFHNYTIWQEIYSQKENRHWLVRARDDLRKSWKTIERFGPGDELVEIAVSQQTRSKHPELPEKLRIRMIRYRRAGFKTRTLATSLLDHKVYPAREIAELYHERWELELAYDEIKTQTLESRETIRSQTPERVHQELSGLVIAYNLVRREMEGMALKLELPANRISFQATLMMMRDLFFWAEVAKPGKLPLMMAKMELKLETFVLPPRRARRYPRVLKARLSKYGINKEKTRQSA
jgi:hypothetical protein